MPLREREGEHESAASDVLRSVWGGRACSAADETPGASEEEEPLLRGGAAALGTPGCSPSGLAGYAYPLVELLV